jgi:hypothetical protein
MRDARVARPAAGLELRAPLTRTPLTQTAQTQALSLPCAWLSLDEAEALDLQLFEPAAMTHARGITLPPGLTGRQRHAALVHEELLRRLFRECEVFYPDIVIQDGRLRLNAIDGFSSRLILDFMRAPSKERYITLYRILRRRYSPRADVAALIVCRNLGVPARRLHDEARCQAYYRALSDTTPQLAMPVKEDEQRSWEIGMAEFILIDVDPPFILSGQTSPLNSATTNALLADKSATSSFLRSRGFDVPRHELLASAADLPRVRELREIIFKPVCSSGRVGVIGPLSTADADLVAQGYERCVAQITRGPALVMAEEYKHGTAIRLNVNHGRVTFVAQSVRHAVVGDGVSSIQALIERKRQQDGSLAWHAAEYVENVLWGSGRTLATIPEAGEVVTLSHDGNEGGSFVDVTGTFPEPLLGQALAIAEVLRCPVLGIDAIRDADDVLWIVDVNGYRPSIGFFLEPRRAYETMDHMIRTLLAGGSTGDIQP